MRLFVLWFVALPVLLLTSCVLLDRDWQLTAVREWARIESWPMWESKIEGSTRGSMFTREFKEEFKAEPAAIQRWVDAKPGPREATPTSESGRTIYSIRPCGGAQFAEVRVDFEESLALIHVYWS